MFATISVVYNQWFKRHKEGKRASGGKKDHVAKSRIVSIPFT